MSSTNENLSVCVCDIYLVHKQRMSRRDSNYHSDDSGTVRLKYRKKKRVFVRIWTFWCFGFTCFFSTEIQPSNPQPYPRYQAPLPKTPIQVMVCETCDISIIHQLFFSKRKKKHKLSWETEQMRHHNFTLGDFYAYIHSFWEDSHVNINCRDIAWYY